MSREGRREPEVAVYAVKISWFWTQNPMFWFVQVEAQFVLRGITTQLTKFHHVIANLLQEIATEVRDVLVNPHEESPYDVLKETLIKTTTFSEQ